MHTPPYRKIDVDADAVHGNCFDHQLEQTTHKLWQKNNFFNSSVCMYLSELTDTSNWLVKSRYYWKWHSWMETPVGVAYSHCKTPNLYCCFTAICFYSACLCCFLSLFTTAVASPVECLSDSLAVKTPSPSSHLYGHVYQISSGGRRFSRCRNTPFFKLW